MVVSAIAMITAGLIRTVVLTFAPTAEHFLPQ